MSSYAVFVVGYLALFGGAIGVLGKMALLVFDPIELIFLRVAISFTFFTIILFWQKKLQYSLKIIWSELFNFFILSITGVGMGMIIGFLGLTKTTAINYDLLFNMSAIFMAGFSVSMLKAKISSRDVLLFLIALVGAFLVITQGYFLDISAEKIMTSGNLLVIIGALGWAFYSIYGSYISKNNSQITPLLVVYGSFMLAMLFMLPYILFFKSLSVTDFLNIKALLSTLLLSLGSTAILFWLWFSFIKEQEGILASFVALSENIGGVIFPMIFLGEKLTASVALGGLMIIVALFFQEYLSNRKKY